MRAKFWIYCNRPSGAAMRLARELGGRRIKRMGSKYKQRQQDVVINYGCSQIHHIGLKPTIQQPGKVYNASSKMRTFALLEAQGLPYPPWTKDKDTAQGWAEAGKVLGRDLDRGSKGRGITIYKRGEIVGDHLFYVKYMKKEREFRFHVVDGEVVHVQEKIRMDKDRRGNFDKYIRSHDNGWVLAFTHLVDDPYPEGGAELASAACGALGLDFGGVDVGWNNVNGYFILEVNSAPGIEGKTLERYVDALGRR